MKTHPRHLWKPLLSALGWTIVLGVVPAFGHPDETVLLTAALGGIFISLFLTLATAFDWGEDEVKHEDYITDPYCNVTERVHRHAAEADNPDRRQRDQPNA